MLGNKISNPIKARQELDKLALIQPDEDVIAYLSSLLDIGDKLHMALHITALEGDYPTLDTVALKAAL